LASLMLALTISKKWNKMEILFLKIEKDTMICYHSLMQCLFLANGTSNKV